VSTTVPSQVSATAFHQVSTVVVSHGNKVSTSTVVASKNQINVLSYINTEHSYAAPKPLLLDNGIAMSDDTNIWVKVKDISLTNGDKRILPSDQMLTNKHIYVAQQLLKKLFLK